MLKETNSCLSKKARIGPLNYWPPSGLAGRSESARGQKRSQALNVGTILSPRLLCEQPFLANRRAEMGSTSDKASGIANEAMGKVKQGIGSAVGSEKLKGEGAAQELKGDAQKAVGDAKAAVKDSANKVADAANENL
jgi:uncharacterized protein YjbJ (UPF0337 family)